MSNGDAVEIEFAGQNWVIAPKPLAVNEVGPASISDQAWMLTLTGVAITNDYYGGRVAQGIPGYSPDDWRRLTVTFLPDTSTPLDYVVQEYAIPQPSVPYFTVLSLEQWAPFVAISSGFHKDTNDAGFAVDAWRPAPFRQNLVDVDGNLLQDVFNGVEVDLAVRNDNALIYRISYHITLIGTLGFLAG